MEHPYRNVPVFCRNAPNLFSTPSARGLPGGANPLPALPAPSNQNKHNFIAPFLGRSDRRYIGNSPLVCAFLPSALATSTLNLRNTVFSRSLCGARLTPSPHNPDRKQLFRISFGAARDGTTVGFHGRSPPLSCTPN